MMNSPQQFGEHMTVQIGGANLAVESMGEGHALVFLHAGVADRRMWQPQIGAMSDRFQTIAYDRRGFGETTAVDEAFSHVEDLRVVLEQLNVENVSLIGCSQGGRVAVDFTLAYPELVNALVLIGPAVSGAPAPADIPTEADALVDALDEAEEAEDLDRINELEANLWLDGPTSRPGRIKGDLRALFLDMNGTALNMPDLELEIEPASAYERVIELSLPVLVVWGDLDFPHVQERCHYLVENIPGAKGEVVAGTAHLPNLEKPEVVNKVLSKFLK